MCIGQVKTRSKVLIVVTITLFHFLRQKGLIEKLNPVKRSDGGYFDVFTSVNVVETMV